MVRRLLALLLALAAPEAALAQAAYPTPTGQTAAAVVDMCPVQGASGNVPQFLPCDTTGATTRRVTVTNNTVGNGYPTGAIPITGVGTGSTGAVTGTLAATAGFTNYLCGFDVSAIGGTATVGPISLTGTAGGNTLTYQMASTAAGNLFTRSFSPCLPASAPNTAISVATTADGTATAVDVNLVGYRTTP